MEERRGKENKWNMINGFVYHISQGITYALVWASFDLQFGIGPLCWVLFSNKRFKIPIISQKCDGGGGGGDGDELSIKHHIDIAMKLKHHTNKLNATFWLTILIQIFVLLLIELNIFGAVWHDCYLQNVIPTFVQFFLLLLLSSSIRCVISILAEQTTYQI